jgi:hypothetical protein
MDTSIRPPAFPNPSRFFSILGIPDSEASLFINFQGLLAGMELATCFTKPTDFQAFLCF